MIDKLIVCGVYFSNISQYRLRSTTTEYKVVNSTSFNDSIPGVLFLLLFSYD